MSDENKVVQLNQQPERLTGKTATEIGGALQRWKELRGQQIKTPTSDAELAGLTEYLANNLLTYAPELLGCWFVVQNEYQPLVGAIAAIAARVGGALKPQACACPCNKQ